MKYVEIRLKRCRLFLTESELINLLARDPALWQEALRRGKAITRKEQANERNTKLRNLHKTGN